MRGAGEGAFTNLQYVGAYEYRVSSTLALVVTARYQIFAVLAGAINTTVEPDEFTTIELAARASDDSALNFDYLFSIVPSLNSDESGRSRPKLRDTRLTSCTASSE